MLTQSIVARIKEVAQKWQTDLGQPFHEVLSPLVVVTAAALEGISFRERFFSPSSDAVGFSGPGFE